jgi:hypothetical protein
MYAVPNLRQPEKTSVNTQSEVIMSLLCRPVTSGADTVQVHIYQGDPGKWLLEVEDKFGNSTVWDDQFDTDQLALDEVMRTIADEGIGSLIGATANG